MTRKNMRGIVGKTEPSPHKRPEIGPGIDFTKLNLTTGEEIKKAAKEKDLKLK
jgi:hypothetical protein